MKYNKSSSQSSHPFELIWMYGVNSLFQLTIIIYIFLTIVNDYSKVTWILSMKSKPKVFKITKYFIALIKIVWKEIQNDIFRQWWRIHVRKLWNINQRWGYTSSIFLSIYTSKNARIEKKHKDLLNITRALQIQSNIPLKYWGECILSAMYIIEFFLGF